MIWLKFCFWCAIFAVLLPSLFFLWMQKKGWIKPSGSFTKYACERYTGDILYASFLHGKHALFFTAKKKPRLVSVEVVLTSGILSMEFRDTADGSLAYAWRNGDPLQFEVPVQKGQTLSFQNQAYRFTGSICFRSGTQPPAAPKETAYP